jgi:ABC-type sugar transport system permease subunit
LLCLIGALGVALVLRYHHSHHNWVRCRLAAEFCRSALATWGLPRAAPLFQDLDLPGVHALTRSLHILHSRSANAQPVPMAEFKEIYLAKRIDDQLGYYQRQEARALPQFVRLKLGFWIATILALSCTLAYAVCHTAEIVTPGWVTTTVFYFLPIAMPVVAAAFISLISINDLQRRVARYREMRAMLEDSRKQVAFCQTWNSLERIVLKTERALLQEVLEWHSITSFTESH